MDFYSLVAYHPCVRTVLNASCHEVSITKRTHLYRFHLQWGAPALIQVCDSWPDFGLEEDMVQTIASQQVL